jgi:hypothetical protein
MPHRARHAIMNKCQPRHEANAIRQFLTRAKLEQTVVPEQERATRDVLFLFERQVHTEIARLDEVLGTLHAMPWLEQFPLNERMLDRAIGLARSKLFLRPFDQAILAAVLVRAEELGTAGETDVCFCEMDADLQPWDNSGGAKQPLTDLYDDARVWVYGDFNLSSPPMPSGWPDFIPPSTR